MKFPAVSGRSRREWRTLIVALALIVFAACSSDDDGGPIEPPPGPCDEPTPLTLTLPAYFPQLPPTPDNPLTVEGVRLGRFLFYDPILSADSSLACAGCHTQNLSFGDFRRFSEGVNGDKSPRQAPTIVNPGWNVNGIFWDGRVHDLEEQATQPVPERTEMDLPWDQAVQRLKNHPDYPDMFCAAFGSTEITKERVVKAIAQFERTFVSANSKYDKWRRGEVQLAPEEFRGYQFFMAESKGDCFHCHGEPLFSGGTFHNNGIDTIIVDQGRGKFSGNPADDGKFKAPSLRNIMDSPPYMHDGRFFTVRSVLEHYNQTFPTDIPNLDPLMLKRNNFPPMTDAELDTLEFFLQTLTDEDFLFNPELSNPFAPTVPLVERSAQKR